MPLDRSDTSIRVLAEGRRQTGGRVLLGRGHIASVAAPGAMVRRGTEIEDPIVRGPSLDEARRLAVALAAELTDDLGPALVGVVLHGSVASGDYVPGRSDLDLLAVVERPLTSGQRQALSQRAVTIPERWPGRVDLRVTLKAVAAAPTRTPGLEAEVEVTPKLEHGHQVAFAVPVERDLLIELSICRATGSSLYGPQPGVLIGEVPPAWVLEVNDALLARWQEIGEDAPHAELTVLTACRGWLFSEEGRHVSKRAAGEWALQRDPSLIAVGQALEQRLVDPATAVDAAEVQRLLGLVRARIAKQLSERA